MSALWVAVEEHTSEKVKQIVGLFDSQKEAELFCRHENGLWGVREISPPKRGCVHAPCGQLEVYELYGVYYLELYSVTGSNRMQIPKEFYDAWAEEFGGDNG